jgi:hypothetical protein
MSIARLRGTDNEILSGKTEILRETLSSGHSGNIVQWNIKYKFMDIGLYVYKFIVYSILIFKSLTIKFG